MNEFGLSHTPETFNTWEQAHAVARALVQEDSRMIVTVRHASRGAVAQVATCQRGPRRGKAITRVAGQRGHWCPWSRYELPTLPPGVGF